MSDSLPKTGGGQQRFLLIAVAAMGAAGLVGWSAGKLRRNRAEPTPREPVPVAASPANHGATVFAVYCASCHGHEGRGDGFSAATLRPPPRDFSARPWRFAVTRESIRTVILDGVPGTAMASSRAAIAPADLDPLVEYVFYLATSRPTTVYEPTEEEKLLRDAGFTDVRGTDPPPLVLADASGKELRLSELKGKSVLIHFWALNCVHCLKEMPRLKELEAALAGRGFTILHVCTDADELKDAQAAAEKVAPGVRVLAESTGLGAARFEVQSLPTVWLIDADGKAVGRASGARDWSAPALRKLLDRWTPPAK